MPNNCFYLPKMIERLYEKRVLVALAIFSLVSPSCDDDITTQLVDSIDETLIREEPDPLVRATIYGQIKGKEAAGNTYAWLGVPYAKPPVDELRWRAPQAPANTQLALRKQLFLHGNDLRTHALGSLFLDK